MVLETAAITEEGIRSQAVIVGSLLNIYIAESLLVWKADRLFLLDSNKTRFPGGAEQP